VAAPPPPRLWGATWQDFTAAPERLLASQIRRVDGGGLPRAVLDRALPAPGRGGAWYSCQRANNHGLRAGLTPRFTQPDHGTATAPVSARRARMRCSCVAARQQNSAWIDRDVAPTSSWLLPGMCNELRKRLPAARLCRCSHRLPSARRAAFVATPVIRTVRHPLASVYAPLVIARFGSGAERIDVRYIAPDGSQGIDAQLATDRKNEWPRDAVGHPTITSRLASARQRLVPAVG